MRFFTMWLLVGACLLVCVGCEPPSNQAPRSVNSGGPPAPPGSLPSSPAAAPSSSPSPASVFSGLSPLTAYYNVEERIDAVLMKVTDGPSANAAADELTPLVAELKLTLRPFLAALAAMPDEARNTLIDEKQAEAIRREEAGQVPNHSKLIEIARQPGNERFKAALQSMFQVMIDEGSTGIRRGATRAMEQLNKP